MFSETGEMQPHSAWTHFNYVSEDESYGYIACCHCKLGFVDNDVRSMLAHMEERHPIINVDDLREVVESEQAKVESKQEDVKSEGEEESDEPPLKRIKLELKQCETACDTASEPTENANETLSLLDDAPLKTDQALNDSIADSVTTATSSPDVKTSADVDDSSAEHTKMLFVEQHVSNKWKLVNRFTSFASMNAARRENRVYSQYSNRFHGLMRRYYRCSDSDCKYRMMSLGGSKEFSLFETEQHLEDIAQEQDGEDDNVLEGPEGIKTPPPRSNRSSSPPSPPSPCLRSEPPSFAEDTPLVMLKPEPLTSQRRAELMQIAKDQGLEFEVDAATGAFSFLKQSQFLRFQIKKVTIEIQYNNDKGKSIEDCFPNTSWGNLLDAIRKKCVRVFKH
uniref:C2H2-type domain-containing protein n=1 Tax=Panagrellus redivivus TaxID=6233 RepID=A0A7E4VJK7_PANRE